jgi:hypothetical protein
MKPAASGVISQTIQLFITTAVRTSNPKPLLQFGHVEIMDRTRQKKNNDGGRTRICMEQPLASQLKFKEIDTWAKWSNQVMKDIKKGGMNWQETEKEGLSEECRDWRLSVHSLV